MVLYYIYANFLHFSGLIEDGLSPFSSNTKDDCTHGHHQGVNIKIRLIIFFAVEDGEALCGQQKQNRELTAAKIRNFIAKFRLKWKKRENH